MDWVAFDRLEPIGNAGLNHAVATPVSHLIGLHARTKVKPQAVMPHPERKYLPKRGDLSWVPVLESIVADVANIGNKKRGR